MYCTPAPALTVTIVTAATAAARGVVAPPLVEPLQGLGLALRSAGVGGAVEALAKGYSINLIVLGWLVAAVVRVAQGSATVAMLTSASIMAPMITGTNLGCHPLYLFTSIGFGAMFMSWMNDSGFWVVSRLSGMTEKETLRTWSVQLTADSVIGLLVTLLMSKLLPMV